MNSHGSAAALARHLSRGAASSRPSSSFLLLAVVAFFCIHSSRNHVAAHQIDNFQLTVHEWGTFTSISSPDGTAMTWLPLTGSAELPSFVEHLANTDFKGGLRGTIRMETPVLYFYSPY